MLFNAAFVLAFFGALRISELLPKNKKVVVGLLKHNVIVSETGIRLFIPVSETDRLGKGSWVPLRQCGDVDIWPVRVINGYLAVRPIGEGNFLIDADGSPLTQYQFNYILKACLQKFNLHQFKFTSHSFRIGAATEAATMGLDDTIIKQLGRWELCQT